MKDVVMKMNGQEMYHNKIHPHKLLLWFGLGSIIMMFTALLSAYVYQQSAGHWIYIELPISLLYNTMIILVSSVSIQWAYKMARAENVLRASNFLILTFVLGLAFLGGQYFSWMEMVANGVFLIDSQSVSGSFVYILSGLHGLHIIGGLVALFIMLVRSVRSKLNVHNLLGLELTVTFWHFLGLLWLYIYVFLMVNQN